MLIMAVGLLFKYPCLRGSCGGPDVVDSEGRSLRCDTCPRRAERTDAPSDPDPPSGSGTLAVRRPTTLRDRLRTLTVSRKWARAFSAVRCGSARGRRSRRPPPGRGLRGSTVRRSRSSLIVGDPAHQRGRALRAARRRARRRIVRRPADDQRPARERDARCAAAADGRLGGRDGDRQPVHLHSSRDRRASARASSRATGSSIMRTTGTASPARPVA